MEVKPRTEGTQRKCCFKKNAGQDVGHSSPLEQLGAETYQRSRQRLVSFVNKLTVTHVLELL